MFERTFSFWRNLVGKTSPTARQVEERRLWIRFRTEFNTTVHAEEEGEKVQLSVQVVDVSLGGAKLIVNQPFEEGQLLGIELPLPHEEGSQTVLACVVRVLQEAPNRWSLGCVFSRELGDEDLEDFGAKRIRHDGADKRTWQRFPMQIQANCQVVGDASNPVFPTQVLDLSASGVGVSVDREVEAGTLLNVELLGHGGQVAKSMLACVVHVTHRNPQEWSLGCNFIHELSEKDLHALI